MKYGLFSLFLLFTCVLNVFGSAPDIIWSARFPCTDGSVVWDAAPDFSGGYIAVGEVTNCMSGGSYLNLCKVDRDGIVLWEHTAISSGDASAYSVIQISGGFVLCGMSTDSSGKSGLLQKVDIDGNVMWSLDLGYQGDDTLLGMCLTPEGDVVAVGHSFNSETADNDVFAVCVSTTGTVLWRKRYVYPDYQAAYAVIPCSDSSGGFIVTGADSGNIFLMKIDNSGNWLWKTSHLIEGSQMARSVIPTDQGGYISAGNTRGTTGFSDVILVEFDSSGVVVSDHVWGTDGPDNAYSVCQVLPAGFVVLVNSNSGTGEGYRPRVVRFDPWYSVIWQLGVVDRDALCYSLQPLEDGGFVVTGKASSVDGGSEYSSCVVRLSEEDLFHWD